MAHPTTHNHLQQEPPAWSWTEGLVLEINKQSQKKKVTGQGRLQRCDTWESRVTRP